MAPETATAAELATMEEDLDDAGKLIRKVQREITNERKTHEAVHARYSRMKNVAAAAAVAAELDATGKEIDAIQALLSETENAYKARVLAVAAARANLNRVLNGA